MKWRQKHGRPFSAPPTRPPPCVRPSARSHSVGSAVRVVAQHQPKEHAHLLRTARRLPTERPRPLLRTTRRLPTVPLKIFGLLCHRGSTLRVIGSPPPHRPSTPPVVSRHQHNLLSQRIWLAARPSPSSTIGAQVLSRHCHPPSSARPSPCLVDSCPGSDAIARHPSPPSSAWQSPCPVHPCLGSHAIARHPRPPSTSAPNPVDATDGSPCQPARELRRSLPPDAGHTGRCLCRSLPPPVDVVASACRLLRVVWATPYDKGWSKAGVTEKQML
jgi:hypothetical protein